MDSSSAQFQLCELIFSMGKPLVLKVVILLNIPDIIFTHSGGCALSVEEITYYIVDSTKKPPHLEHLYEIVVYTGRKYFYQKV